VVIAVATDGRVSSMSRSAMITSPKPKKMDD
jgi:hypothetical protein